MCLRAMCTGQNVEHCGPYGLRSGTACPVRYDRGVCRRTCNDPRRSEELFGPFDESTRGQRRTGATYR